MWASRTEGALNKLMFAAAMAAVVCTPAAAKLAPVGKPIGKWAVHGEADPMTDKMSCVAYYGGGKFVQVTDDSFAVSYGGRGGLKGYTLRFDNDEPLPMALPDRIEERVGAFIIKDSDPRFSRLVNAKRVRVQALTVLSNLANDDIDLADLPAVFARLKGPDCN